MAIISVHYGGEVREMRAATYGDLVEKVKEWTGLGIIKLVHRGRVLQDHLASPVLVVGSSKEDAERLRDGVERTAEERFRRRERDVVNDLDTVEEDEPEEEGGPLSEIDPVTGEETGFGTLETLDFPDRAEAAKLLALLARDPGIRGVMRSRRWFVPRFAEMRPDGKVGVDLVCVLGLNENHGSRILLRLRTDDLRGFRKLLTIQKVLYHELAHNERSQHDAVFYRMVSQIERDADHFAYRYQTNSHRLGGRRRPRVHRKPAPPPKQQHEVHRLGGDDDGNDDIRDRVLRAAERRAPPPDKKMMTTPPPAVPLGPPAGPPPPPGPPAGREDDDAMALEAAPAHPTPPGREDDAMVLEALGVASDSREAEILRAARDLASIASEASRNEAATTLLVILNNAGLGEDRYKRIRVENKKFHRTAGQFPPTYRFLEAVGFERDNNALVLRRQDPALLWFGRSALNDIVAVGA